MPPSSPKLLLFEHFATVAKALSSAPRLDLLELLAQGERSVEGLAQTTGLSIANTSQHLQVLRRAGLVLARRQGAHVLYCLSDDDVLTLLTALRQTAERHVAEVDRLVRGYFKERDALEAISREELVRRMEEGSVMVLDVRPPEEFTTGHISGAINIPVRDLKRRLHELPAETEIIAYCRGAYCVLAFEAVATLRQNGMTARRVEDGFPEWRAAGLPIQTEA